MTGPARISADLSDIRTSRLRDVDLAHVPEAAARLVRAELAAREAEAVLPPAPRRELDGCRCARAAA
jgi:hypothetical protein